MNQKEMFTAAKHLLPSFHQENEDKWRHSMYVPQNSLKTQNKTAHNFIKDGKLFSVSIMPPTEENKSLTDEILATFNFE